MLPFKNGNFFQYCDSNIGLFSIARHLVIVGRAITLERKPSKKKQRTDTKRIQKGLRVITLQGAKEKSFNIAVAILEN